ncbi:KTSC domain-containing protein [Undibacterium sp. Rencai35W]|uniref:KTSC domain-containing protein n=1 Tax=Undibacterium sp. Rencai35W TaxID=3413046 RepID=UPI003BF1FB17
MTTEKKHPVIALTPVTSSQIDSIGHDPKTNTLAVKFKGWGEKPGNVYHYQNFTPEMYADFKSAKSIGSHFKTHIKPATEKHPYLKIS